MKPVYYAGELVGVNVDNLGEANKYMPLEVFVAVISLLKLSDEKTANKGNAMNCRLGDRGLALRSVEGHVAHVIYGREPGIFVFKRITPISRILEWAGVCENGRGYLRLMAEVHSEKPQAENISEYEGA